MKKFLFIFFIILGYQKSIQAATFYSDTIWIKLENGALLRLVGNDFDHKFPKKVEFSKYMKDFLNSWEEIKEKSPAKRVNVFYEKRNTSNLFRITESDPSGKTFLIAPEDSFKFSVPQSNILDFNIHKIQARLYLLLILPLS
jgi:hypothetical protein